jgi:sulfonate transport system ATP-binding protein
MVSLSDIAAPRRFGRVLRGADAVRRAPEPAAPGVAVELAGLAKSFGDHAVLRGIDLTIRPGEFLAVVGHSGCGKSTLLRLLAGLDRPSAGWLALDGSAPAGQVPEARILFQDARLLPWRRVLANVGIGSPPGWRAAASAALRNVGLEDRADEWPAVLSGGQRQRVALARALVTRPRLLLLDEPLGALDALTRLEMQALVEQVWQSQGFTAVLVTHDVAEAVALADRIIVLDEGVIVHEQVVAHARPRSRGSAGLAAIEGSILAHVMRRRAARVPALAGAPR